MVIFLLQASQTFRTVTYHEGTRAAETDAQLFAQGIKMAAGTHRVQRFQLARAGVLTGVDNGTVGPGNAGANIDGRLQYKN